MTLSPLNQVGQEHLAQLCFLFNYCRGSWGNRPDLFDGFATLDRFGRECDWVAAGYPPHYHEWMDDVNGRFWDAIEWVPDFQQVPA